MAHQARNLTGARYGVVATIDGGGSLDAVLTIGTTEERHRELIEHAGSRMISEHFGKLIGPVVVDNYRDCAASAELETYSPWPAPSAIAAPIGLPDSPGGTIQTVEGAGFVSPPTARQPSARTSRDARRQAGSSSRGGC